VAEPAPELRNYGRLAHGTIGAAHKGTTVLRRARARVSADGLTLSYNQPHAS